MIIQSGYRHKDGPIRYKGLKTAQENQGSLGTLQLRKKKLRCFYLPGMCLEGFGEVLRVVLDNCLGSLGAYLGGVWEEF